MRKDGGARALSAAKGFAIAAALTFAAIAVLTVVVWKCDITDEALAMCNQCIKIVAVSAGTLLAVGRGGTGGFVTGALIGTVYTALGYGCYAALGGPASADTLLGEWLVCAAAGAFTGAVAANLPRRK